MRRAGWVHLLFLMAGGLVLVSCPSGFHQVREVVPAGEADRPVRLNRLLKAPTRLQLGKFTLTLEAYLWRDFQPVSPPGGQPLRVSVKVIARPEPEKGLAYWLKARRVYLVYEPTHQTWEADLTPSESTAVRRGVLEAFAKGGPRWSPGAQVEVIVRLQDNQGHTYLLRASRQVIQKTY